MNTDKHVALERMACEAGMVQDGDYWFSTTGGSEPDQDVSTEALARFAALVRADALEEAAKECEGLNDYAIPEDCAAAIRALSAP